MAAEGNRRTADVRCKGFTNLFILSKIDFENAMKDYPEAHKLLKKRAKYTCCVVAYFYVSFAFSEFFEKKRGMVVEIHMHAYFS
jgi:hypothetical protein